MSLTAIIPIALGLLGIGGGAREDGSNARNTKWILIFVGIAIALFLLFSVYLNYQDITFTDYFYQLFTGMSRDEFIAQQDALGKRGFFAQLLQPFGWVSLLAGGLGIFARK